MDKLAPPLRMLNLADAFEVACSRGWLSQQTPEFQQSLFAKAKLRSFAKDKHLYRIEDESAELFCVVSGAVMVSVAHPILGLLNGHLLFSGDWFGESATLAKGSRLVTMQARTPITVISFTRGAIDEIVRAEPQYLYNFFDLFRLNQQMAIHSAVDLLFQDPRARMCARLLTLCGARGEGLPSPPVDLPLTQEELALTSCLSRKTVHQFLNEFVRTGICELHYRRITVLDPEALGRVVTNSNAV